MTKQDGDVIFWLFCCSLLIYLNMILQTRGLNKFELSYLWSFRSFFNMHFFLCNQCLTKTLTLKCCEWYHSRWNYICGSRTENLQHSIAVQNKTKKQNTQTHIMVMIFSMLIKISNRGFRFPHQEVIWLESHLPT